MNSNIQWDKALISREERWRHLGSRSATLWFTGLSGSGKSTVAAALEKHLVQQGIRAYRLDGDNIRHGLNQDLGFSPEDRQENIRRIGEVSTLLADSGCLVLASFISPYRADRARVRHNHEEAGIPFLEVFVDTPIEVCEKRDPKGLYAKAREGEIKDFTGISAPYEVPESPEIHLRTENDPVEALVDLCMTVLKTAGLIP
ncbi:MAG: adenylyl-sulfate kinase [Myxococcota bacterium]|nr:adenylyl-sulfate kinase [Myxococcota bacterium]